MPFRQGNPLWLPLMRIEVHHPLFRRGNPLWLPYGIELHHTLITISLLDKSIHHQLCLKM